MFNIGFIEFILLWLAFMQTKLVCWKLISVLIENGLLIVIFHQSSSSALLAVLRSGTNVGRKPKFSPR